MHSFAMYPQCEQLCKEFGENPIEVDCLDVDLGLGPSPLHFFESIESISCLNDLNAIFEFRFEQKNLFLIHSTIFADCPAIERIRAFIA